MVPKDIQPVELLGGQLDLDDGELPLDGDGIQTFLSGLIDVDDLVVGDLDDLGKTLDPMPEDLSNGAGL